MNAVCDVMWLCHRTRDIYLFSHSLAIVCFWHLFYNWHSGNPSMDTQCAIPNVWRMDTDIPTLWYDNDNKCHLIVEWCVCSLLKQTKQKKKKNILFAINHHFPTETKCIHFMVQTHIVTNITFDTETSLESSGFRTSHWIGPISSHRISSHNGIGSACACPNHIYTHEMHISSIFYG